MTLFCLALAFVFVSIFTYEFVFLKVLFTRWFHCSLKTTVYVCLLSLADSEEHLMAKSVPACLSLPSPTKSFQLQNVVEGPKSSVSGNYIASVLRKYPS